MKEELKQFDIDIDSIKESNDLIGNIYEAIRKMQDYTLKDRFEVILNNNLIESKQKLTGFKTILGCRISYDNLDKNISFIVREDTEPSYEELARRINKAISKLECMFANGDEKTILDDLLELDKVLRGSDKK